MALRWTPRDLRPLRVLATLASLAIAVPGVLALVSGHYHGESSRHGAVVDIDGIGALRAGLAQVVAAAMPLAFWWRTPKAAALWAGATALVAIVLFVFAQPR